MKELIRTEGLSKLFPLSRSVREILQARPRKSVRAVDDVTLAIGVSERLGIAGESGCGKTTLAKLLVRLFPPSSGSIVFEGQDIARLSPTELRGYRRVAQMVFQNPYTAINPRFTIREFIEEPLIIHDIGAPSERKTEVENMLEKVRLSPAEKFTDRFTHQLSGGERQRALIARGLILKPKFLVADEPASMLDVSIRAGILDLLSQMTAELNLTTIYISHDLSLLSYMCERIVIMYLGRVVETGSTDVVIDEPMHPYTQALIAAVPVPDPGFQYRSVKIEGTVPHVPTDSVPGCLFAGRCPSARADCIDTPPPRTELTPGHFVHCHLYR